MPFGLSQDTDPAASAVKPSRLGAIAAVAILAFYVFCGCFVALNTHGRIGPGGAPLFYDFSAFYQAGGFADAGHAARAYDDQAMATAANAAFPGVRTRLPWNYPPTFQLLLAPLAALPYVPAWLIWSAALCGLYGLLAWRLVERRNLWFVLLFPAAAMNLLVGQNGLLSTVLIGGGVLMLGKRPFVGGVLLGLMTYKPQFALLAPLVLLCSREWRALGGAIASGAMLAGTAALVLGLDPWLAFLHKILQTGSVFSSSTSAWRTIPTVQIMARTFGLGAPLASALHWSVAAAAAAGAIWVWRKTGDARLRAGALAAATLLVTPYLRLYDLALLILPLAVLLPRAGARPRLAEQALMAVAWLAPGVMLFTSPRLQIEPLFTMALMGLVVQRTLQRGDRVPAPIPAPAMAT